MALRGMALKRPEPIGVTVDGISVMSRRRASRAHWPIRPSPMRSRSKWPLAGLSACDRNISKNEEPAKPAAAINYFDRKQPIAMLLRF